MASVILLAPPLVDSAPRPGREPARASAINDVRAAAWRKAADEQPDVAPRDIEIETPGREDDSTADTRKMGRRELTLTAERRSQAWRWDETPGDETYAPVGFTAQRIAQEVLSPGLYHEDFRSALAAYSYAREIGASQVVRTDGVSILV
jgi:hypothetical protein